MPKLLLATDLWTQKNNKIEKVFKTTINELYKQDIDTVYIEPSLFKSISFPMCPNIRFIRIKEIDKKIEEAEPDFIHIATEGIIGIAVRNYCLNNGLKFTTSYHTNLPERLCKILCIPKFLTYKFLHWFHDPSYIVMVPTISIHESLFLRGFKNTAIWHRGVDTTVFYPRIRTVSYKKRPVFLYVGDLSAKSNINSFLSHPFKGTTWVVGDGNARELLERRYKKVEFWGDVSGHKLADMYSNASVLVFPNKIDTFENQVLESLSCGTPVASYPVPGPKDIFCNDDNVGYQHENIHTAMKMAIETSIRSKCQDFAKKFSLDNCAKKFLSYLCLSRF